MDAKDDITNKLLGSALSFEFLGACLLVAVAWGSMTARLEVVAEEQKSQDVQHMDRLLKMEEVVRHRGEKLNHVEQDIAVMKNDMQHVKKSSERTEKQVEEILKILREDRRGGGL